MKIQVEYFENAASMTIEGRFGVPNHAELSDKLTGLFKQGIFNIVLDLSGEVTLYSAALRTIVMALKECRTNGGDLRIANPSERVNQVLQLAGYNEPFLIYQDVESALKSFKSLKTSADSV